MKFALYEHPSTGQFAWVEIPQFFSEEDDLPVGSSEQWFSTREDALRAVGDLFDRGEVESEGRGTPLPA